MAIRKLTNSLGHNTGNLKEIITLKIIQNFFNYIKLNDLKNTFDYNKVL